MTRRQALAVLAATLGLLVALDLLLYSLYRNQRRMVGGALEGRLSALGRSLARVEVDDAVLSAIATANELEDAFLLDGMRVVAGAHTAPGPINLLRIDADAIRKVRGGAAYATSGYTAGGVRIVSGYFAAPRGRVLVLEAGASYYAPITRLRWTFGIAGALSIVLAVLFSTGLWLGMRALERARIAHGHSERLAAVGQMAAMVAHEVRNPLGILRGQVELLRERLPATAAARERERFEDMLAEIQRINQLTEEFLTLARDAPLSAEPIDVAALATDTVAAARLAVPGANIEIDTEGPAPALGDPARLRQAILNLLYNALQAGGENVSVHVTVAVADEAVRLSVSDDGPGVPAELRATLFEPFVGTRPGGSGLGLAVAARIAERHGGRLALAESRAGAKFTLTIPAAREAWDAS